MWPKKREDVEREAEQVRGKDTLSVAAPLSDDSLVQSFQIPAPWLSFH